MAGAKSSKSTAAYATTLEVRPSDELRAELAAFLAESKPATVQLLVQGVAPPPAGSPVEGFRVFINKPDATLATAPSDPHFVGAVAFQPGAGNRPQSFFLDAGPAFAGLSRAQKLDVKRPLQVTLVPVPSGAAEAATSTAINVASVQLRVKAKLE